MSRWPASWPGVATLAMLCLALGGCGVGGSAADGDGNDGDFSSAQVDTPELRAQKAAAGIDDCPTLNAAQGRGSLPDVTLPCLGGGPAVDLADVRGPAVVNLWATYCGPCRAEAPIFQAAHEQLGKKVRMIGVDYQEPQPGKAIAFADELGLTYPMLSDPYADLKADLRVPGLPVTILVDADGQIAYSKPGPIDSEQELADLLEQHLGIDDGWAAAS